MTYQTHTSRYELKYTISEPRAQAIRDFVRGYLDADKYMPLDQPLGYRVTSLYLDGPRWQLYQQSQDGVKNRFKLRVRYYDHADDAPAFAEIKYRITDTLRKERVAITKSGACQLLEGRLVDPTERLQTDERALSALRNFSDLSNRIGATGKVYVAYWREAYVIPDSDQVRVTFDRKLAGYPHGGGSRLHLPQYAAPPAGNQVILELKFTDRFPGWLRELARTFHLVRRSVPKYVTCVDAIRTVAPEAWKTRESLEAMA